jgi:Kef-type K+ transport system membrane component KefB
MSLSSNILIDAMVIALFCGMLCAIIAFSKDRSWLGFAVLGILLGPIGLIVTGLAQPYTPKRTVIADEATDDSLADNIDI